MGFDPLVQLPLMEEVYFSFLAFIISVGKPDLKTRGFINQWSLAKCYTVYFNRAKFRFFDLKINRFISLL